ncbi:hypothetical protein PVAP13_9NG124173 [Panicum virgatum]|uniref:Uncharacterized protein n=1 Tax=Panicum virgatum TaxID=38727 RepID=A0A8T0MFN7_PANVG|nr:hypothetical protein PVAP13_9NG124173 [Panicum virgatum]
MERSASSEVGSHSPICARSSTVATSLCLIRPISHADPHHAVLEKRRAEPPAARHGGQVGKRLQGRAITVVAGSTTAKLGHVYRPVSLHPIRRNS